MKDKKMTYHMKYPEQTNRYHSGIYKINHMGFCISLHRIIQKLIKHYNTFFMLNLTEHEISKILKINKVSCFKTLRLCFLLLNSQIVFLALKL